MAREIMLLNGSPRVGGNTDALIEQFIRGAEEAGHRVRRFDIRKMDIRPCIGCLKGGTLPAGGPCVQQDDMLTIYEGYEECDTFLFASPLYFWGFTSLMKKVIDRLFAPMEVSGYQNVPQKDCMMIIAAEEDNENNFKAINQYFDAYVSNMSWRDAGRLLVGGVMEKGTIQEKPEALHAAYQMGRNLL